MGVGDFNHDNLPDVVAVNFPENTISVLLGESDSSFAPPINYPTGQTPTDLTVFDLDCDGHIDIAVTNRGSNTVRLFWGAGDGTFSAANNFFTTDTGPYAIKAADLNNDFVPDLVVTNHSSDTVTLHYGVGGRSFAPRVSYVVHDSPDDVAVGDLNGDLKPDICTASTSFMSLLLSTPSDDYTSSTVGTGLTSQAVALADFNHDGALDVVQATPNSPSRVTVLLNIGDGTFLPRVDYAVAAGAVAVCVADINLDSWPDILTANSSGSFTVLLGSSSGQFSGRTDYPTSPLAKDIHVVTITGDLRPDVLVSGSGVVSLSTSKSLGWFGAVRALVAPNNPRGVCTADLNNDSRLDILVGTTGTPAALAVYQGNGDGSFQPYVSYPVAAGAVAVSAADIDHDGYVDVAVTNSSLPGLDVRFGSATGLLSAPSGILAGGNPTDVMILDVNHDTHQDLIVTNGNNNVLSILLGNGDRSFRPRATYATNAGATAIAAGDFNHDEILDLVTANKGFPNTVSVLLGNGDGSFLPRVDYDVGTVGPEDVAIGDLNQDGNPDIIACNGAVAELAILMGQGTGGFSAPYWTTVDGKPWALVVADANADQHLDVLTARSSMHSCGVQLGDGTGSFEGDTNYGAGWECKNICLADLDGDNALDAVLTDLANKVVILLNMSEQGTTSVPEGLSEGKTHLTAWPNPTSTRTALFVHTTSTTPGRLAVFDIQGRLVRFLVSTTGLPSGDHNVEWDLLSDRGTRVPAGMYFIVFGSKDSRSAVKVQVLPGE